MVNFSLHCSSLKVSVFQRLLRNPVTYLYLKKHNIVVNDFYKNGDYFIKLASIRVRNQFWKDVFNSTYLFLHDFESSLNIDDALFCCLPNWNNSMFKVGNKPVNYQHWAHSGVLFIYDIHNLMKMVICFLLINFSLIIPT